MAGPGIYQGTFLLPLPPQHAQVCTDTLTDLLRQGEGQKKGEFMCSIDKLHC